MITQYGYTSVPAVVQGIVSNKVGMFDRYVLFCTGENEYTALIRTPVECKEIKVYRAGSLQNYHWEVSERSAEWDFNLTSEYYVFSNVNLGQALSLPHDDHAIAIGVSMALILALIAVVFKGVFFRSLRKGRVY